MGYYPSVTFHHMEDTLEVKEHLKKLFNLVFFWPNFFKDSHRCIQNCDRCYKGAPFSEEMKRP